MPSTIERVIKANLRECTAVISVPQVVRNKALAVGASAWIEELPVLVQSIEAEWSITVESPMPGGTEAFVAEATLEDGTPAVLKLLVPRGAGVAANEITVLRMANGQGCVRLIREDAPRGALLMERLGRSLHQLGLSQRNRLDILCSLAQQVWRPAPDCGLPSG